VHGLWMNSGLKAWRKSGRLAYVGITRARRLCTISFAANRRVYRGSAKRHGRRGLLIELSRSANVDVPGHRPVLYGGGVWCRDAQIEICTKRQARRMFIITRRGGRRLPDAPSQGRGTVNPPRPAYDDPICHAVSSVLPWGTRFQPKVQDYGEVIGIEGNKLEIRPY